VTSVSITFTRSIGGYIVRLNRALCGLILFPLPDDREWRIVTEHGEMATAETLTEAKCLCSEFLLLDHA
jgi:hypothetical protein